MTYLRTPSATEGPTATSTILHFGWLDKPDTLNPAYAFLAESYSIFDLIYTSLTTESPDDSYVVGQTKDWSVADNVN